MLQADVLTIGFARRFATYKRGTLLLRDSQRLLALLRDTRRPVQFIFAGKAHPADNEGKQLIKDLIRFAQENGVQDKMIFAENYDIGMARKLVQGVDVWLNNPRRPQEASGTSGMKAAINGVINCSILDGWWAEAYDGSNGWAIKDSTYRTVDEDRDNYESQQLFNLLEREIIPSFYERGANDIPVRWVKRMKESIVTGLSMFSSNRMVSEYNEMFYIPAEQAYHRLTANNAEAARKLVEQKHALVSNFDEGRLSISSPWISTSLADVHVGDSIDMSVEVQLGGLRPEDVTVEAYGGSVDAHNEIIDSFSSPMQMVRDNGNGNYSYKCSVVCRYAGRFGLTARIKAAGNDWDNSVPGFVCWPK